MATAVKLLRLNAVQLSGYSGKDATVSASGGGAFFSLAVTESWQNKETHEWQSRTSWIPISCFGKVAEMVKERVHKGTPVAVFGRLNSYERTDRDTQQKSTALSVLADRVQVLAMVERKEKEQEPESPVDRDYGDVPKDALDDIPC